MVSMEVCIGSLDRFVSEYTEEVRPIAHLVHGVYETPGCQFYGHYRDGSKTPFYNHPFPALQALRAGLRRK